MISFLLAAALAGPHRAPPPGCLIVAGGGPTPPEVVQRALQLAGGVRARVLIVPQASARTDAGQPSLRMWQRAGAERATLLDLSNLAAARREVARADLIWMPGGSQLRLMRVLTDAGLVDAIRERFRQGATVGGTSAGAAVMSLVMLSDARGKDGKTTTVEAPGLALWADVIVDQHFLIRNRSARLQEAVLRHPDKTGVGIDERTAVVVRGHFFEVIGVSKVMVLDARRTTRAKPAAAGAAGVVTTVLQTGMRFDLQKGAVVPQVAEAPTTGAGDASTSASPRTSPSAGAGAH